jgi:hypothetical protein
LGKEKAFQTMSSMTSAQLISVAAKGLTLGNPPCIPTYTVSTKKIAGDEMFSINQQLTTSSIDD